MTVRDTRGTAAVPQVREALDCGLLGSALAVLLFWAAQYVGVPSAFEAPAEGIMARTPPQLAGGLLLALGALARPVAVLGAVAVFLAIGALSALPLALTHTRSLIRAGLSVAVAGGSILVVSRWLALAPAGSALVAASMLLTRGVLVCHGAGGASLPESPGPGPAQGQLSRRSMLGGSVLASGSVLLAANAVFLSAVARASRRTAAAGAQLFPWQAPEPRRDGFAIEALSPEVTPTVQFYVMSKNVDDPSPVAGAWHLAIKGQVARRLSLDYEQLLALPRSDLYVTLRCISNDVGGRLMSTALFSGVPLRLLIERSRPLTAADTVVLRGIDGHSDSIPLSVANRPEVLIAYAMNGAILGYRHGFPARVIVPGIYGFKQVKWLNAIELCRGPYQGHWQHLGWTQAAVVKTVARIDVIHLSGDGVEAAGVAFAGDRGISLVQVRVNGGPWRAAALNAPALTPFTWVQWRAGLEARRGLLEVRAIDGTGTAQDETAHSLYPDGAGGLHRVRFAW